MRHQVVDLGEPTTFAHVRKSSHENANTLQSRSYQISQTRQKVTPLVIKDDNGESPHFQWDLHNAMAMAL